MSFYRLSFDPISFDPMSFEPRYFDPGSFDPKSFGPMLVPVVPKNHRFDFSINDLAKENCELYINISKKLKNPRKCVIIVRGMLFEFS